MTSKTEQLLLELYLLRTRYSPADIERVAQLREIRNEPLFRSLLAALRELQTIQTPAKSRSGSKGAGTLPQDSFKDPQAVVRNFLMRLSDKKVLREREQLDSFAEFIGVHGNFGERRELVRAVREKLEELPKAQAAQKIASFMGNKSSDSRPYVELAKTLMRS